MRVYNDVSLSNFEAWAGAEDTKECILCEGKETEFENLIEELYPDGISETELNDYLRFEAEEIYRLLGIETEDDDEE